MSTKRLRSTSHRLPRNKIPAIGTHLKWATALADDATANALAEYCVIEPTWEQMGVDPGISVTEARPISASSSSTCASGSARNRVSQKRGAMPAGSHRLETTK